MGSATFFMHEVWRSFTRNLTMQLTAIGTVAVMIVLLGGFLFVRQTLSAIGIDNANKIVISAFLRDGTPPMEVHALQRKIQSDPRVRQVVFVPKSTGLHEMRDRLHGQIDTSLLTSNPLPDAFRIRAVDPHDVSRIAAEVRRLPGIENVTAAQDVVERLLRVSDVLGRIGVAIVGILIFTAAIIISNTIRLTVFARRREIAIMQLVGASGTFVRMPFVFEGLLAGVLGALVAIAALAIARAEIVPKLAAAMPFVPLGAGTGGDALLALQLLGVGAAVGIVAAWLSVSRYLRA